MAFCFVFSLLFLEKKGLLILVLVTVSVYFGVIPYFCLSRHEDCEELIASAFKVSLLVPIKLAELFYSYLYIP